MILSQNSAIYTAEPRAFSQHPNVLPQPLKSAMRLPVRGDANFLCQIHSGKKHGQLKSVRINGRERQVGTLLHDGDNVEAVYFTGKPEKR